MSAGRGRLVLRPMVGEGDAGGARHLARHIRRMALLVREASQRQGARDAAPAARAEGGSRSLVELTGRELTGPELAGLAPVGPGGAGPAASGAGPDAPGQGRGWWVLAQGGPLDESDFEARERAREELLQRVRKAGVLVGENVWVWDLSGRAQLVLSTLPTLERARKLAARLRQKGLAIVVRREMP